MDKKKKEVMKFICAAFWLVVISFHLVGREKDISPNPIKIFYVNDEQGQHFLFNLGNDVYSITRKAEIKEKEEPAASAFLGLKEISVDCCAGEVVWLTFFIKKEEEKKYLLKYGNKKNGINAGLLREVTKAELSEIAGEITAKVRYIAEKNPNSVGLNKDQLKLKFPPDRISEIKVKKQEANTEGGITIPEKWVLENEEELRKRLMENLSLEFTNLSEKENEETPQIPVVEVDKYLEGEENGTGKAEEIAGKVKAYPHTTFEQWQMVFVSPPYEFKKIEKRTEALNTLLSDRAIAVAADWKNSLRGMLQKTEPLLFLIFVAVVILVIIFMIFVLAGFLYVKVIRKNNTTVAEKIQTIEEGFYKFETPAKELERVSNIIYIIKAIMEKSARSKWIFSVVTWPFRLVLNLFNKKKREEIESLKIDITGKLDSFDGRVKEVVDIIKNQNSDFSRGIDLLHSKIDELKNAIKKAIGKKKIEKFLERINDIEGRMTNSLNFSEALKITGELKTEVNEEFKQKENLFTGSGDNLNKQIESLEKSVNAIQELEKVQGIKFGNTINGLSSAFSQFESEMHESLNSNGKVLGQGKDKIFSDRLRGEIVKEIIKAGKIIDYIKDDYVRYNKVTARLTEIKREFLNVLEDQNTRLKKSNADMEKIISTLDQTTTTTIGTFDNKLTGTLEKQITEFDRQKGELAEVISNLSQTATTAVETFGNKFTETLSKQGETFSRQKGELAGIINNLSQTATTAVETFGNKFTEALSKQGETFSTQKGELAGIINNLSQTATTAVDTFGNKFTETLSKQGEAFSRQKGELAGIINDLNQTATTAVETFGNKFTETLSKQGEAFSRQKGELVGIINDLNRSTNTAVENFDGKLVKTFQKQKQEFEVIKEELKSLAFQTSQEMSTQIKDSTNRTFKELKDQIERLVGEKDKALKDFSKKLLSEAEVRLDNSCTRVVTSFDYAQLYVDYINKTQHLKITKEDGPMILKRINGEPKISEDYRGIAINLFKVLMKLEPDHRDNWYWQLLLNPLKERLDRLMVPFLNREGKTIFDYYLKNQQGEVDLKDVNEERLRQLINQEHWGQIWDPLLRCADFFSAYFNTTLNELSIKLQGFTVDIKDLLQGSLGYRIETYTPLQIISKELLENGSVQEVPEHFKFFRQILPNIKHTRGISSIGEQYNLNPGKKIVLFVEQLGLSFNNQRIREPRLVFYSPHTMKHYE